MRKRLAVLASGHGSNFEALANACHEGVIDGKIVLLISNKKNAPVLEKAKNKNIQTELIHDENNLISVLKGFDIDFIILAGYLKVLSPTFVSLFQNRIINIHPSLLPAFPGLEAQKQALHYGVKVTGCTVHFVDENIDHGPIIRQEVVTVMDTDTVDTLSKRILEKEHECLVKSVAQIVRGHYRIIERRVVFHETTL